MTNFTIQLGETDYQRLERAAKSAGKAVQLFISEWIAKLPEAEESFEVTQDPVFLMEGYESEAPDDFSANFDKYLYGEGYSK